MITVKVSVPGSESVERRSLDGEHALHALYRACEDFKGTGALITVHFRGEHRENGPDFVWTESA